MANRRKKKHLRTVFLAITATLTLVFAAVYNFDVEWREMAQFFGMSVFGLLLIMALAFSLVAFKQGVQRQLEKRDSERESS